MSCSNCYLRTPPALCPALASQPGNLFWDWIKQDVQSLGVPAKGLAGNPSGSSTPPKNAAISPSVFSAVQENQPQNLKRK